MLAVLEYLLSPDAGELWKAQTNRLIVIVAIWVVAFLGRQIRKNIKILHSSEEQYKIILQTTK